jgi:GT2 family glycosyltransferase
MEPIDIVLLTYNRLDYLIRTVDALYERTSEPFRLTVVDNASESDVRNWLVGNRERFHRVLLQPENEHIAGFQRGIDATTSDPLILGEADLIVPLLTPCWLAQFRALMQRHPDFGLLSLGLDPANRPSVLGPESVEESTLVDGEIVEENVGLWFQQIRRDALRAPYTKDSVACNDVRAAGYRVGWALGIRALHLGWDDYRLHPAHLARKNELAWPYPYYREVELIGRPPTLEELARAAPIGAAIRGADVPDAAVLELAWGEPLLGSAFEEVTTVHTPDPPPLPLDDCSAGAVVLVEPDRGVAEAALSDAFRVAARVVVVVASLATFDGAAATELAPEGWTGVERPWTRDLVTELAAGGDRLSRLAGYERFDTLEHRDDWVAFFAAGAFGPTELRLFVFHRTTTSIPVPERLDTDLQRWQPLPRIAPSPPWPARLRSVARRLLG